jgi:hypothetical protein
MILQLAFMTLGDVDVPNRGIGGSIGDCGDCGDCDCGCDCDDGDDVNDGVFE